MDRNYFPKFRQQSGRYFLDNVRVMALNKTDTKPLPSDEKVFSVARARVS